MQSESLQPIKGGEGGFAGVYASSADVLHYQLQPPPTHTHTRPSTKVVSAFNWRPPRYNSAQRRGSNPGPGPDLNPRSCSEKRRRVPFPLCRSFTRRVEERKKDSRISVSPGQRIPGRTIRSASGCDVYIIYR